MQAFLLFTIGMLLAPQNVHSNFHNAECALCVLLCWKQRDVNLPSDGGTLTDGIHEYPTRANQLSNEKSPAPNEKGECPYTPNDAKRLLHAVKTVVLSFYSDNYEKINMRSDGGVGLSILKHELSSILKENESNMSEPLKDMLKGVHKAAGFLGLQIMDQANKAIPDPSRKFGAEVLRNFSASPHLDEYNGRKTWKSMEAIEEHFGEFSKIGDEKEVVYPYLDFHCIVTLVESCSVPYVCQKMYLEEQYSQYMLMHQVLYQIFGIARGCVESNAIAEEFKDRLCSKAYLEAQFLEKNNFPTRFIDLFAEQVGFCGVLGYESFMRADWLREIMSWLSGSESGCALDVYGEKKTTDAEVFVTTDNGEQESCLVHLTSVSLAALAMNLRYMFDSCSIDIFNEYIVPAMPGGYSEMFSH